MNRRIFKSLYVILIMVSFNLSSAPMDKSRIVELPVPTDPTISFRILFNAGTQYDPIGKEGLAFITAQLISEGATKTNAYDVILKKLFPLAASFYVRPEREIAIFSGRVHKDNLEEYYKLFIQQITQPAFKQDELDRIKEEALNYLTTDLKYSSDEELGKAVLYNTLFAGTPYAHPDAGTIAGLKSITVQDVENFYKKYYNKENFTLGIGGGYNQELVEKLWNDLQILSDGIRAVPPEITPKAVDGYNVVLIDKNASSTAISIGFPIDVHRGEKEWYALAIANSWLGEHRNSSSHLYQVIREARGLNYGDYSYIENFPRGGRMQLPPVNVPRRNQIFEIWIRPVPNETDHFALRAALRELQMLIDKGMTQDQFELTRKFLKNYVLHYATTTNDRLGYMLDDKIYGIEGSHLALFRKMMDEISLEDVNAVVRKYLQYKNMTIAIIANNAQSLKDRLASNTPSPIKYTTAKPQSVLDEDMNIINYQLPINPDNVSILTLDELFQK